MSARISADLLVIVHLLFILFVLFGGLLAIRRGGWALLHLPAVAWGALIEFNGWICPLTPLENHFRRAAGSDGYTGGFVEHYLIPVIYPDALNREMQFFLGMFVIAVNLAVYVPLLWKHFVKQETR